MSLIELWQSSWGFFFLSGHLSSKMYACCCPLNLSKTYCYIYRYVMSGAKDKFEKTYIQHVWRKVMFPVFQSKHFYLKQILISDSGNTLKYNCMIAFLWNFHRWKPTNTLNGPSSTNVFVISSHPVVKKLLLPFFLCDITVCAASCSVYLAYY